MAQIENQVRQFLSDQSDLDAEKVQFAPVPKGKPGDLALTFFDLAKSSGTSPVELAQQAAEAFKQADFVRETLLMGPYLNLVFKSDGFFQEVLQTPLQTASQKGQTIVVEFSGPNTNKPLHLGHMRNHALGISMSNLYERTGADVKRVNIINDKGLALAKTMLSFDRFSADKTPESEGMKPDHFVGSLYVQYETELKKAPSLTDELPEIMRLWESGDPHWTAVWQKIVDWVLEGMRTTYKRQGIWFDKEYIESQIYKQGVAIAQQGLKDGIFEKNDEGAIVVNLEDEDLGTKVVLRADGTAIYLTNDLATAKMRYDDYHPDQMIYTVADEQAYYFKALFSAIERLKLLDRKHLYHLSYGLVNLPEGRMKSREGTVVDADNLMDELAGEAEKEIAERNKDLSETERKNLAEQIMNAAWKFYLLSTAPRKTMIFDPKKSIAFEGATGPYIQYAGVRIRSIFDKAGMKMPEKIEYHEGLGEEEKNIGALIRTFPETLDKAVENHNPTYLVTYLLNLSQEWSSYYANTPILQAEEPQRTARIALAAKVFQVLEAGLQTLGIEIPEKM